MNKEEDSGRKGCVEQRPAWETIKQAPKKKILALKAKYVQFKTHKKVKKVKVLTKYEHKIYKSLKNLSRQVTRYKYWDEQVRLSLKVAKKYMGRTKLVKVIENLAHILKVVKERKKEAIDPYFTVQQRIVALLVMRKSVVAYKLLCKMFYLPPPANLLALLKMNPEQEQVTYTHPLKAKAKKMMEKVSIGSDLLRAVHKVRAANQLKKADRYCLVLFREFDLRIHTHSNMQKDYQATRNSKSSSKVQLADHCLVFMIRGIWEDLYKLPAAYYFYKGPATPQRLAELVKKEIMRLQDVLFIPVATICNEEGCSQEGLKYLVNESKKDFKEKGKVLEKNVFFVNGQEIVPLFDPPQLLIAMRNHLLQKDLKYYFEKKGQAPESGTAKWKHIVEFYNYKQKDSNMDLVPKLTKTDVFPKRNGTVKLDNATVIFSHKCAAFMAGCSGALFKDRPCKRLISEECIETAHLLKFFNDLFDSVNGCRKESRYNDYNKLLTKVKLKSVHHSAWLDFLQGLRSMKSVDKSGKEVKVSTIDNWIWTIEGFQVLMRNIFFNTILDGVWMRWFNQDPLNSMFKDYCDDRYLDYKKYAGY